MSSLSLVDLSNPYPHLIKTGGIDEFKKNVVEVIGGLSESIPLRADADYIEIRDYAHLRSEQMGRFYTYWCRQTQQGDSEKADATAQLAEDYIYKHTKWTRPDSMSITGMFLRFCQSKTWSRLLNKKLRKAGLQASRVSQILGRGRRGYNPEKWRSSYLPTAITHHFHKKDADTLAWMKQTVLDSCSGDEITLFDAAGDQLQNQLNELRLRTMAMNSLADMRNLRAYLVTLTCPSRFHPTHTITARKGKKVMRWSEPNPKFNPDLTAQDGVKWLAEGWVKARALIHKALTTKDYTTAEDFFFFGNIEGHTDATPHRHFVFWLPPDVANDVKKILEDVFLWEKRYGQGLDESEVDPGAKKHRVDFSRVHSEHGATAYATKMLHYALKTLDVNGESKPSAEALYARAIGARRFTISQHNISIWRFLRRCPDPDHLPDELRDVWHAAHGLREQKLVRRRDALGMPFRERRTDYENGSCDDDDMLTFITSIAQQYKPCWVESDFYDIEFKTLADYAEEHGEVTFPEFITIERRGLLKKIGRVKGPLTSFERFLIDDQRYGELIDFDDDGKPILNRNATKRFEQKLNSFNEPVIPSKFTRIYRDAHGRAMIGRNAFSKTWTHNRIKSAALRNELTAERKAILSPKPTTEFLEKTRKLQLSVGSQGVATRRCVDVETLATLGLDALQEKYGQVDIDEHGRPIFDERGDFALKHEGSITEPVFRRPFGPPIRLKFDPGRGLIQEKEAA